MGRQVTVDDIALVILKTPGSHNQGISLPYPDPLLDLPLDPAHPGDSIRTSDPDMVGPHHQFCHGELLPVPPLRQADTNGWGAFVYSFNFELIFVFSLIISN